MHHSGKPTITVLYLRCGDRVHSFDDPRHVGRVEAIFHGAIVKVRWDDTRWISFLSLGEIMRVASCAA